MIREKIRSIIADSRNIIYLLVDVRIERLSVEDDTIVAEGTYRYIMESGEFHVEFDGSTLEIRKIEIR